MPAGASCGNCRRKSELKLVCNCERISRTATPVACHSCKPLSRIEGRNWLERPVPLTLQRRLAYSQLSYAANTSLQLALSMMKS